MYSKLLLGVAREIITPEIGGHMYGYHNGVFSNSIHDDLNATAFMFCQGETKAMLVSITVCTIQNELSDRIRAEISKENSIPFDNIILHAIHTHSAPDTTGSFGWGDIDVEYCESIFIPQILKAAKRASNELQSVRMGIAFGDSLVGCNRRELDERNRLIFGQRPWGCFDPKMTIMTFKNDNNETVANIVFYGCHGTSAGINHEISRDWSGIMCDRLEKVTGGITAFCNGPEGDVGPRLTNGVTTGEGITATEELGGVAAQDAVRIYNNICGVSDIEICCSSDTVKIPLKDRMSREDAEKVLEETANETINIGARKHNHAQMVLDSYSTDYEPMKYREFPQSAIRLGNTVIVATPFELFSEIGLRINSYAKNCNVIILSNSNGSEGYFATESEIPNGGYEIGMFLTSHVQQYADHADYHLIKETMRSLKKVGVESCIE